jgi:hypothetical protein
MQCPACRQENPEQALFCTRCHTPLSYVCPACKHVQAHGGQCDQCGVDFAKYAALLMFRMQQEADQQRARAKTRGSIVRQILLLPVTGGISLVRYLLSRLRGE